MTAVPSELELVRRLASEIKDVKLPELSLDASLDALGLDSLDRLELLVLIEERHSVYLPDEFLRVATVGDIVRGIRESGSEPKESS